ncbi:MAG: acetyl-CoA carboxylase biotin carboxylase subunit family protein [Xenococcus sp. (in: cyanobacteria)]
MSSFFNNKSFRDKMSLDQIAVSVPRPTSALINAVKHVEKLGYNPIPLFQSGLESVLYDAEINPESGVVVPNFRDSHSAAEIIKKEINERKISLTDWINLSDDTSEVFLLASPKLLPGRDYTHYASCRIKPIARDLLYKAQLVDHSSCIVNITKPLPKSLSLTQVVVKPIMGFGSEFVRVIEKLQDWQEYQRVWQENVRPNTGDTSIFGGYRPYEEVLLEPLFKGIEIRADGFVEEGKVVICAMAERVTEATPNGFREIGGIAYKPEHFPYESCEFEKWVCNVLKTLEFRSGVFHLEAIRLDYAQYELIEINPRMGGGGCSIVTESVSGIDLGKENIALWLGLPPSRNQEESNVNAVMYSVLYHHDDGIVLDILGKQRFALENNLEACWVPFVSKNDRIFGKSREHYLGELHEYYSTIEELMQLPKDVLLKRKIEERVQWMRKSKLVSIR